MDFFRYIFGYGFFLFFIFVFIKYLFFLARSGVYITRKGREVLGKVISTNQPEPEPDQSVSKQAGTTQLTTTERMQLYLRSFEKNIGLLGGLAFKSDLKSINFDYSLDSLMRLDLLLQQIRNIDKPSYSDFLDRKDHQNFMILTAVYLSTTIARATNMPIKWYDYTEAMTQLKPANFPERFETMLSCKIGGEFHMPLGVITEVLFDPNPTLSCVNTSKRFVKNAKSINSNRQASSQNAHDNMSVDQQWLDAMKSAGSFAAFALYQVEGGGTLSPTQYLPKSDGTGTFIQLEGENALDRGLKDLELGREQAPYLILADDIYANLPTGRTDAISLKIRSYGENPLNMEIIVPYRHAEHVSGFAIHSPILGKSNVEATHKARMFKEFYDGIHAFKLPDNNFWSRYLDESL